ncbi:Zn-dependent exopeptidase [Pseudovirgaria hyperparasitica]|uniref:Peptide hydrolase n=1 Tax=Pseudovirgaria hyperparasitica TaxID=470096 RepID=A0A6A6WME0_9PEZI|nr:Zn-dependent exopeptidase [Pseudovirgaria hyperparasitica]KAF2763189.1 Zn-dependent exopeptidase [Pseudovirgaria hyperparasitica]
MSINSFASNVQAAAFPTTLTQKSAVNALIPKYNITNVKTTLTKFSSFYNRYYKSKFGAESAQWLFDQISAIATSSGVKGVTVRKFTHSFADQFSIIATLPGKSTKTIVLGAHQDSINVQTPSTGQAQGADDDGTGSMAIMEAFKTMLTDPRLKSREADNTIEFHWYAGEEAGLLGSQAVFQQYAKAGTNIAAMLQSDMVGYSNGPMGVITDFTNDALNTFTRRVIEQYTTTGYVDSECGYGCSDHASATRAGYPSSFIFEAAFEESNPDIHTPRDTIDKVDFAHVLEHGKLMLGWAMELAFSPSI